MARSNSHKFGQIIGNLFEVSIEPALRRFADENNLYLDKKGPRKVRKDQVLVRWKDSKGNNHNMDYVLERGGTDSIIGTPVAFIETAWRRGTRHSINKATEIQGSVLPLAETYKESSPFKGAILAGDFTKPALTQLESNGFAVLYFPYNTIIQAFAALGVDIAFNDKTEEADFALKSKATIESVDRVKLGQKLLEINEVGTANFISSLKKSVSRQVERVMILSLHGQQIAVNSISEAISWVQTYNIPAEQLPFVKHEIIVKYNTGEKISAEYFDQQSAINFLSLLSTV